MLRDVPPRPRASDKRPQKNRITLRLARRRLRPRGPDAADARTASAPPIKLVNRATFIKDFTTLGLELEDRVRLDGGAAQLLRPGAGHGARLQRRQHHRLLDHELPGPRPARRGVARGARSTGPSRARARSRSRRAPGLADGGDAALDGGGAARGDRALRACPTARPRMLVAQLASSVLVVAETPAPDRGPGGDGHAPAGRAPAAAGRLPRRRDLPASRPPDLPDLPRSRPSRPRRRPSPTTASAPEEARTLQFFRGKGCPTCNKVGYRGRRAIFEVLAGLARGARRRAERPDRRRDRVDRGAAAGMITHARALPGPRPRGRDHVRRVHAPAALGHRRPPGASPPAPSSRKWSASIADRTSDTRSAGKPPRWACSRTTSALGAM